MHHWQDIDRDPSLGGAEVEVGGGEEGMLGCRNGISFPIPYTVSRIGHAWLGSLSLSLSLSLSVVCNCDHFVGRFPTTPNIGSGGGGGGQAFHHYRNQKE